MFIKAERNPSEHFYGCCSMWGSNAMGARWANLTEELSVVKGFGDLRSKVDSDESMSLFDVITSLPAERAATDPRDYIYGLLGLVNGPNSEGIVPDYNLSVSEIYTQSAFKMITKRGDLAPLILTDNQRHESIGLPSWVPDWSAFSTFNPKPYDWGLFQASKNQPVIAELVQGSILSLKGIVVTRSHR
jgi:hypothetical protein